MSKILKKPIEDDLIKEGEIQKEINKNIDENKNIIFNSGAGSGKTYALVESLKYILQNKSEIMREYGQKVLCITYTNVATNEIKERIGTSELLMVSTIHEAIWGLIKNYQKELVKIHEVKIRKEIKNLKERIKEKSIFFNKNEVKKVLEKDMKEKFYKNYGKSVKEIREIFADDYRSLLLKNINEFKKNVQIIIKIKKYRETIKKIRENEFKNLNYDSQVNNDKLEKMKISHDTLLEYGLEMIKNYKRLRRLIIDKYPYIFIDEYQDTNDNVIKIMKELQNEKDSSAAINFFGFFGDPMQNIYGIGIGERIEEYMGNYKIITKEYNRRSSKEIILLLNKIRKDICQKSIYEDSEGGSVEFYKGTEEEIDFFIEKCKSDLDINIKNRLNCLVLKNEIVAKNNGFSNVYSAFKESSKYKGSNWEQLNTELLSNDLTKLGDVQIFFYNLLEFKEKISNKSTLINRIITKEKLEKDISRDRLKKMTLKELKEIINILLSLRNEISYREITLGIYLEKIVEFYKKNNSNEVFKYVIRSLLDLNNNVTEEKINKKILNFFTKTKKNIKKIKAKREVKMKKTGEFIKKNILDETVKKLLEIELSEYSSWYKFIKDIKDDREVIYRTYHSTKGLEYDNVVVIMGDSFARKENYFSEYLENPSLANSDDNIKQMRNLLYVACSRARKNLRIFHIGAIDNFEKGIKDIFGEIKKIKY